MAAIWGDEGIGGGGGEARRCRFLEDKCWLVARCWRWWWLMARVRVRLGLGGRYRDILGIILRINLKIKYSKRVQ